MPDYFAEAMPWDARRKILLELCGDVTDVDVIQSSEELRELDNYLRKPGTGNQFYSVDEYKKIATARKSEINKQLQSLPGRIDEARRAIPDGTVSIKQVEASITEKTATREDLLSRRAAMLTGGNTGAAIAEARKKTAEAETALANAKSAYATKASEANAQTLDEINKLTVQLGEVRTKAITQRTAARQFRDEAKRMSEQREQLRAEYAKVAETRWDEAQETCPTCGQELPKERIKAMKDDFNQRKSDRLIEIEQRGKRSNAPNRLTGLLFCADCGAKLTHHNNLVQGKYIDDAFTCSRYRGLVQDCTVHYASTQKLEAAILSAIQRISWYVCNNEQEFVQRVQEASVLRQEESAKDCRKQIAQAKKRHAELDGLVKKLYESNARGLLPDKHFSRLLAEYDEEQAALENSIAEWQKQLDNWNADRVRMAEFIDLSKRYTDFTELTTPMLNEFIEKIIVHEGEGRGKQRRQRLDFYFNFIGAFEVPAGIVTPMEKEAERRQQEEQAAKEARSKELYKARYEKRKQANREFTARKQAGLLTPEEQEAEERRLAHNREWQKEWRAKQKADQPEKPRKRSLTELAKLYREGAKLTPEEAERLAAHKRRKAEDAKRFREKQKAAQLPKPKQRTLKELAECSKAGLPLTPEETERLEAHRNRKKVALQDLKTRADTDPAAAEELAKQRAHQSDAVKKTRQKMYKDAAAGDPEAQARYERYLAAKRESYHRKKQAEAEAAQAN